MKRQLSIQDAITNSKSIIDLGGSLKILKFALKEDGFTDKQIETIVLWASKK